MEVLIESLGIIGGVEGIGSVIGNLYRTPKLFEGQGQGEIIAAGELSAHDHRRIPPATRVMLAFEMSKAWLTAP